MIAKFNLGETKNVADTIRSRISVRTYDKRPLPEDVKNRIKDCISRLTGPFDVKCKFTLLDSEEAGEDNLKLGTYGVIKGASSFIAAVVENKPYNMEQLGYQMEWLILYVTEMGLGTCWLAGTFDRSSFLRAVECKSGELMPVVVPVGYPGEKKSLLDAAMRAMAGSAKRKEWKELFFKDDFSTELERKAAGKYEMPLEMVRLAPSASNKQPWRILLKEGKFHFYLCHSALYGKMFKYDIQKIDMGIAMLHFEAAAADAGLFGNWNMADPNIDAPRDYEYIITWIPK